jgi:hypothetical protein
MAMVVKARTAAMAVAAARAAELLALRQTNLTNDILAA